MDSSRGCKQRTRPKHRGIRSEQRRPRNPEESEPLPEPVLWEISQCRYAAVCPLHCPATLFVSKSGFGATRPFPRASTNVGSHDASCPGEDRGARGYQDDPRALARDCRRRTHMLGSRCKETGISATYGGPSPYTAIGTVCNLASRLCAEAKDAQILVSSRIAEAVDAIARLEDLGNLDLKGLRRPVAAYNVAQNTTTADAHPHLTVVENESGA
jgi:hypothetical protein